MLVRVVPDDTVTSYFSGIRVKRLICIQFELGLRRAVTNNQKELVIVAFS